MMRSLLRWLLGPQSTREASLLRGLRRARAERDRWKMEAEMLGELNVRLTMLAERAKIESVAKVEYTRHAVENGRGL